jgi:hypothetical protein
MIAVIEILITALLVITVGTPIVETLDKWKKEMDEDE